jgi:hypothetical protein
LFLLYVFLGIFLYYLDICYIVDFWFIMVQAVRFPALVRKLFPGFIFLDFLFLVYLFVEIYFFMNFFFNYLFFTCNRPLFLRCFFFIENWSWLFYFYQFLFQFLLLLFKVVARAHLFLVKILDLKIWISHLELAVMNIMV